MIVKIFSLIVILVSGIFLTGCSVIGKPAGLKVESDESANVFIDGKIMGKTPYENSEINGKKEITLKIIPEITEKPLTSWESKVMLMGGTWTLVRRELAITEKDSSGQILYMTKNTDNKTASIVVASDPDGATLFINNEEKGVTPITINGLQPADYTIEVKKDGFISRNTKIKLLAGYQLNAQTKLGQGILQDSLLSPTLVDGQPTVTPIKITPTTGRLTPTPAKSTVISPTPAKSIGVDIDKPYVLIKDTEVGFLRVREKPSTASTELAQVKPQEKFSLLDEENGWYKIAYQVGKEGWVAGQYVTKYE